MSLPAALLLGTGGRLPLLGHIRRELVCGPARLALAARAAPAAEPGGAWAAACAVWAALEGCAGRDRYTLCRAAWERLVALDRALLGPQQGRDLSLLVICTDSLGHLVSGCGLGQVWALDPDGSPRELVEGGHPLLGPPGLPAAVPRVLEPTRPAPVYVARPTGDPPAPLDAARLAAQCGIGLGGVGLEGPRP